MGHVQTIGNGGDGCKRRDSRAPFGEAQDRRATARAGSEPPRGSLYDEVTARIIAELEEGRFPWVPPWSNAAASPGLPRNATTGRAYAASCAPARQWATSPLSSPDCRTAWSEKRRRFLGVESEASDLAVDPSAAPPAVPEQQPAKGL